jgi:tetratricopeptide (TPR) repeat protein
MAAILAGCAAAPQDSAPDVQYLPGADYHLLMAEIALERGEYLTVAQEYLSAADQSSDPEIARRATEYAFEYGYDVYALRAGQRWAALDPEDPRPHEYLSPLYLRRHDLDRALFHLQAMLGAAEQRTDDDYLGVEELLAEENELREVTTALVRLGAERPDLAGARLAVARAALRSGSNDLALASARQAAAIDPDLFEARLLMARALFASGNTNAALAYLKELQQSQPNLAVELDYIRLTAAAGNIATAIDELVALSKRYGEQPEFIRLHALINLTANNLDVASRDFNKLLSDGHNVYECFYYLGQIATTQHRHRDAIRFYSRIRGGRYLVPAQASISESYSRLGDMQTALNHIADFVGRYPAYTFDMLETRAQLLQTMNRTEEALQLYDLALRHKPDNVGLLLSRGAVLEQLGRLDDGLESMERAAAIAPTSPMALNTLGYTLANRTRRHAEAYRYIRLALEMQPASPAIIDSMGWVLYRRGRLMEARSFLELSKMRRLRRTSAKCSGPWVSGMRPESCGRTRCW